jgi:hypothetical protein
MVYIILWKIWLVMKDEKGEGNKDLIISSSFKSKNNA